MGKGTVVMPTFEELVQTLKDASQVSYRRRNAASSLGKLGDKRAVGPLLDTVSDDDRYLSREAIQALGNLGNAKAVSRLAGLLKHSDSETRRKAVIALGEIGHRSAAAALKATLEDSSFGVRSAAERALEKLEPAASTAEETPLAAEQPAKSEQVLDARALMKEALAGAKIKATRRGSRYSLTVPLSSGRTQKVVVAFGESKDEEGLQLITIHSVCAPADPRLYKRALEMNLKLPYGAIAIAELKKRNYFVLVDTQLALTAQALEIRRSVISVARRADAIEKQLTGQDQR